MSTKIQPTHPMGPDGIVRCFHGEQVDRHISRTDKNPGRYVPSHPPSCPSCVGQRVLCLQQTKIRGLQILVSVLHRLHLFSKLIDIVWTDDPIFSTPSFLFWFKVLMKSTEKRPAPQPAPSNGPCTPRPTPLQSTPAKRKHHAPQTPSSTPSKKARIAAIEAGLRDRLQDESPHHPPPAPEQHDALPFTHGVEPHQAPSPASETATDVEQEEPPRARYSFLGLSPTQESESGAGPSTPRKRPSIVDEKQDLFDHYETSSSALLTPPQSMKTHAGRIEAYAPSASGSSSRPEPVTPTRHKGKERARCDQLTEAEVRHPGSHWHLEPLAPLKHSPILARKTRLSTRVHSRVGWNPTPSRGRVPLGPRSTPKARRARQRPANASPPTCAICAIRSTCSGRMPSSSTRSTRTSTSSGSSAKRTPLALGRRPRRHILRRWWRSGTR
jgi:hypothetical protein